MAKIHDKIIAALKRQKTMEKAIELLRSLEYFFFEATTLEDMQDPLLLKYSWMVRKPEHKDFTRSLIFGIKMWGKKNSKIIIHGPKGFVETIRVPWKDKADINFRKIVVKLKFPEYLNYDERRKWRTEYHKQKNNPKRVPSEWYLKVFPDIQFI